MRYVLNFLQNGGTELLAVVGSIIVGWFVKDTRKAAKVSDILKGCFNAVEGIAKAKSLKGEAKDKLFIELANKGLAAVKLPALSSKQIAEWRAWAEREAASRK